MGDSVPLGDSEPSDLLASGGRLKTRPRLRSALLDALLVGNVQTVSERDVAIRAGISPARFRDHYRDLDDCVCDAFDDVAADVYTSFATAFEVEEDSHERLTHGIEQALVGLLANPGAMRLWFLDSRQTSDPELRTRRTAARDRLVALVTRPHVGWGPDVLTLHVEFLFGVLSHAAYDELAGGGDCAKAGRRIRDLLVVFDSVPA